MCINILVSSDMSQQTPVYWQWGHINKKSLAIGLKEQNHFTRCLGQVAAKMLYRFLVNFQRLDIYVTFFTIF